MDPRQRLIDEVARLCGSSVAVLNLEEVQAGSWRVGTSPPRSTRRLQRAIAARQLRRPRFAAGSPVPIAMPAR